MTLQLLPCEDKKFKILWKELFNKDNIQYPLYTELGNEYQRQALNNFSLPDKSFLIHDNDIPIIGVLLTVNKMSNSKFQFSCFGRPVFYLKNVHADLQNFKGAKKLFKRQFLKYLDEYKTYTIDYIDFIDGRVSFLGDLLLDVKSSCEPSFFRVIDLNRNKDELHQMIRRRYKGLINWGIKNLKINIIHSNNYSSEAIKSFKKLHFDVSGRKRVAIKLGIFKVKWLN